MMGEQEVINKIKGEARKYFQDACPSHDFTHVERVYKLCEYIGKREYAEISRETALKILSKYKINSEITEQVLHCISSHRFRNNEKPRTLEAKILFNADKLDSIGAIGVIRAYAWAGKQGIKLYSKLQKIKNQLFTETAKKIVEQRHNFMVDFFERLDKELKGEA